MPRRNAYKVKYPDSTDSTITIPPVRTISIYERVINKDLFGRVIDTTQVKLATHFVPVRPVPPPTISVPGLSNGDTVSAMDISNAQRLKVNQNGFIEGFEGLRYKVKSFKLRIDNMKTGKSTGPSRRISRLNEVNKYL